jgi:hypothetical protein
MSVEQVIMVECKKEINVFGKGKLRTFYNSRILRYILCDRWSDQVIHYSYLLTNSNEHKSNYLQQNTTYSAPSTHLELHTWYRYENSDRCNPAEITVPVKVFTVQNWSDIWRSDILK